MIRIETYRESTPKIGKILVHTEYDGFYELNSPANFAIEWHAQKEGAEARAAGMRFHDNPYRLGEAEPLWALGAWEEGYSTGRPRKVGHPCLSESLRHSEPEYHLVDVTHRDVMMWSSRLDTLLEVNQHLDGSEVQNLRALRPGERTHLASGPSHLAVHRLR